MEINNISEISDKIINFMNNNKLIFDIKFDIKYFKEIIKEFVSLYKKNEIEVNNSFTYQNDKINLIYYKKIDKNKITSNILPKTIKIMEYIYINNKNYLVELLDKTGINEKEKEEFLNFFEKNNYHDENIINWLNVYGLEIINNLYSFYKTNTHLLSETENLNLYGSFTSLDIHKDIEQYFNCIYTYRYMQDIQIEATFISDNKTLSNKFIKSIFIRSLVWLKINKKNLLKYCSWLTCIKKELPNQHKSIGPKEVNTGSTYRGYCDKIQTWRLEEIKKVLIHEMGHGMEIEFSPPFNNSEYDFQYDSLIQHLLKIFNIPLNTEIRIYEAYNETWSLIANCIFSCIEFKKKNLHIDNTIIFNHFMKMEINFSLFQCAKILHFFDFKNFNDFFSLKGFTTEERKKSKYKQTSSILSYYIIKSSFLYNIDQFMEYCQKYNKGEFNIKFNPQFLKKFQKLIDLCLNYEPFINTINKILKIINNKKEIQNHRIYNSLRMTVIDL